jgi:2-polyprenyl-6-methoxyphenol hydroxylase-like FAD-dependent oxidoreductase
MDNRLRQYDRLPRYLEGFMACGDTVYALNPVYAQGMTVAALSALAIDRCLHEQHRVHPDGDLRGLASPGVGPGRRLGCKLSRTGACD